MLNPHGWSVPPLEAECFAENAQIFVFLSVESDFSVILRVACFKVSNGFAYHFLNKHVYVVIYRLHYTFNIMTDIVVGNAKKLYSECLDIFLPDFIILFSAGFEMRFAINFDGKL
jgi:hypothetical protein